MLANRAGCYASDMLDLPIACPACPPKERLHEWSNHDDQGIAAVIDGHTHRAAFEHLSLPEKRYLESKLKIEGTHSWLFCLLRDSIPFTWSHYYQYCADVMTPIDDEDFVAFSLV